MAGRINVFLAGPGLIGSALLRQIASAQSGLSSRGVTLTVCGIARSKRWVISKDGVGCDAEAALAKGADGTVDGFVAAAAALKLPNSVLCDCTASDALTPCYAQALGSGLHVVTANKKANSADMGTFAKLREMSSAPGGARFLYEANVGAGLPVIAPLAEFVATGDEVIELQGILSGTLAYIFNTIDAEHKFSDVVAEAGRLGFCEPDPRDDLGGSDVARKITILARLAGAEVELKDVVVDPICPDSVSSAPSVPEFMERLAKEFDPAIEKRRAEAAAKGEVLRVIASYRPDRTPKMKMALENVPSSHAAASLSGSENIVVIRTKRYDANPCVVKGPGAGADVTAAGVFGDLLKLRDCAVTPA
eukprot:TRINITY_DN32716_c0_g1_i1.p2 TRINITY_DN32716_c0_g1~~TRINITY_DN32716_c0_g1_i1.p2  ORF type:complete len:363 (+),score=157.03 TRINITY_DN32716_c0_g1_i1:70-1158(+)